MPQWKRFEISKMKHALENIYMLAQRKRTVVYRYPEGCEPEAIGPKSSDEDWDHIIRFCQEAGLESTVLRTQRKARKQ